MFCTALNCQAALAQSNEPDTILTLTTVVKESSCSADFKLNLSADSPVQLPRVPSSSFKKNSLSALTYFSLKLENEKNNSSCRTLNGLNGIQFDTTPNASSLLGSVRNQATDNPAQNINVELILFNSDWTQQYKVDLQSKETIDFNKIPGWAKDKDAKKVNQLNFAVRYTKDATPIEEVSPGVFYVVLPFMLKFN